MAQIHLVPQGEATPLIEDSSARGGLRSAPIICKSAALLLAMKLFGNALEYQVAYFNIDAYMAFHENATDCWRVPCSQRRNLYSTGFVLLAAVSFVLSTLGGLISDRFVGCVRVLIAGGVIQFWASLLFPVLIQTSQLCRSRAWYYIIAGSLTLSIGLVDPLLLYALMQHSSDSRSRRFLMFSYFFAAAINECLGCLPAVLRYLMQESGSANNFDFVGIVFSSFLIACTFFLAKDPIACERLRTENFLFPRLKRLRRYYIIVAGFIPFTTAIILCRNVFYWTEIKYYAKSADDNVASAIALGSYLLATMLFSLIGAVATAADKFPSFLTIRVRIQWGLWLMLTGKIVLFTASLFHGNISAIGERHPVAIQCAYFAAGFVDGLANSLTDVAMYELVDCVADSCARAMYVGIFYTTWGMGLMLTGITVIILQHTSLEGDHMTPEFGHVPRFYVRYAIVIGLLLTSIVYYSRVTFRLAQPLNYSDDQNQEISD